MDSSKFSHGIQAGHFYLEDLQNPVPNFLFHGLDRPPIILISLSGFLTLYPSNPNCYHSVSRIIILSSKCQIRILIPIDDNISDVEDCIQLALDVKSEHVAHEWKLDKKTRFVLALDLIKCLQQMISIDCTLRCAPFTELPSNIMPWIII